MKYSYKIVKRPKPYVPQHIQLGSEESYCYFLIKVKSRFFRKDLETIVYIGDSYDEAKKFKYMFEKGYVK